MERDSFVFYRSFFEAVKALPVKLQRDALMNILAYAFDGETPSKPDPVFILIKPQIDSNNKRFEDGCKAGEFGKRGGRPKKNPTGVINKNPTGVSETDNSKTPLGLNEKTPQGFQAKTPNVNVNEKCEMSNEKEKRESPPAAQLAAEFDQFVNGTGFSQETVKVLRDWVVYRWKKGSPYVGPSLQSFLERIGRAVSQYGEARVLWVIGESLSNGWNNIRWEKLDEAPQEPKKDYNAMVMTELMEDL